MSTKTVAIAAAMVLSLSGAAWAQTAAGGSAEGNMNSPGSVKSNSEKDMERSTGSGTGGPVRPTGGTAAGGTTGSTSGHSGGGNMSTGGTTGGSAAGAR